MKGQTILFLILFCIYVAGSVVDSTVTVSAYHSGGSCVLDMDQQLEQANNLLRFGTTNGSYLYHGASSDVISLGPTGYLYSSKTGTSHNSTLQAETFGVMQAFDTAGLHTDNTYSPATPCDTGNLAIANTTGNDTPVGKIPQTASAEIIVGMVGRGGDEPASYTSAVDFTPTSVTVDHSSYADEGYNFEDMIASIAAGHNRNSNLLQHSEFTHYHVVGNSNESAPLNAGSLIKFEAHEYTGPDIPAGWTVEEEVNETVAINNTTNSTQN